MKTIDPDPKRLPEILDQLPKDVPIFMLNLLRFRDKALYPDGRSSDISGREAYGLYSKVAATTLKAIGGEVFFMGNVKGHPIAPPDEIWDSMMLIKYPSIEAFKTMIDMPEYQAGTIHRTAALSDSRLIANVMELI